MILALAYAAVEHIVLRNSELATSFKRSVGLINVCSHASFFVWHHKRIIAAMENHSEWQLIQI